MVEYRGSREDKTEKRGVEIIGQKRVEKWWEKRYDGRVWGRCCRGRERWAFWCQSSLLFLTPWPGSLNAKLLEALSLAAIKMLALCYKASLLKVTLKVNRMLFSLYISSTVQSVGWGSQVFAVEEFQSPWITGQVRSGSVFNGLVPRHLLIHTNPHILDLQVINLWIEYGRHFCEIFCHRQFTVWSS